MKNNKGITLVALIITVIVLLILAVVAIRAITGDGIIFHAQKAKENYSQEKDIETLKLAASEYKMYKAEKALNGETPDNLGDYLRSKNIEGVIEISGTDNCTVIMKSGTYYISEKGVSLELVKASGLYQTDGTYTPWDELVAQGIIGLTNDGTSFYCGYQFIEGNLIIDDSVTSIDDHAFSICRNLKSVEIPNSVTSIGYGAFGDCWELETVIIPDSVTSIGAQAFSYCKKLKTLEIPNSATTIGEQAFQGCANLTAITIPDRITGICEQAFWGCTSLETVTIPASVTSIGYEAFAYCTNLTQVYFEQTESPEFDTSCFYKETGNITTFWFKNSTVRESFAWGEWSYYNPDLSIIEENYNW